MSQVIYTVKHVRNFLIIYLISKKFRKDVLDIQSTTPKSVILFYKLTKTKLNSAALVRKRTIPTERPQPAGEVSANFS
jgi:hypothetical protein